MKKKMAWLLTLFMLLFALGAAAEGWYELPEETEDITLLEAGGAYQLTKNETRGLITVKAGKPVRLMLDGKTLTCEQVVVEENATLILLDSGGGQVAGSLFAVKNMGTFIMEGGKLLSTGLSSGVYNTGEFTMKGGKISGATKGVHNEGTFTMESGEISADKDGVYNEGTFTMNAGTTVKSYTQYGVYNYGSKSMFTMNGGTVTSYGTGEFHHGVKNQGTFTMNGGKVAVEKDSAYGVFNEGAFTMHGGLVEAKGKGGYGVHGGVFTMHGGEVLATGMSGRGVYGGRFTMHGGLIKGRACGVEVNGQTGISAGTIEAADGKAVEKGTEEKCILPGSRKVSGGFDQPSVVIERIPQAAAADLPKTGDASMLGAWVCLLAASGAMGMKLRRKR